MNAIIQQYRLSWNSGEEDSHRNKKIRKSPGRIRFITQPVNLNDENLMPNVRYMDMEWIQTGKKMIVLGKLGRTPVLLTYLCSGKKYILLEDIQLSYRQAPWYMFASSIQFPAVTSDSLHFPCDDARNSDEANFGGLTSSDTPSTDDFNSATLNHADRPIIFFSPHHLFVTDGYSVQRWVSPCMPDACAPLHNTAVCCANSLSLMPWLSTAPASVSIQAYIGFQSPTGYPLLGLCEFPSHSQHAKCLIKFQLRRDTRQSHGGSQAEVTSLQCLAGPGANSRLGLLVGRRNGIVQLWDDRWPGQPAMEYLNPLIMRQDTSPPGRP
ncbi:unnamed protein product, partial [Protopolystoma xenopodis]